MPLPADNPFAAPSDLVHALPPFDRIREEHFEPAIIEGMAQQLVEVEAIVLDPAEPSIENTLEALERSGSLLTRACQVLFNLIGSAVTDGLRAVEETVVPRLAAHHDAILMDARLFERVRTLYQQRAELGLEVEQDRLLERLYLDQIRAGAGLSGRDQERLGEINQELSALSTTFRNQLQADSNDLAVRVDSAGELDGMTADAVQACAEAAASRGLPGYLITLVLPTSQPALAVLRDRGLRQRLHQAAVSRGRRGNEHDTRETLTKIVQLRAERAGLLGFADHASYAVADQTAGTVDAVMTLLTSMIKPAVVNARAEQEELTRAMHDDGVPGELAPWDWAYYAEKVAQQRFARDSAALRPWFELDTVVQRGIFAAAERLYGLRFVRRDDLPAYHPDVQVYEVLEPASGATPDAAPAVSRGLFLADWYARDSKRGGAWMSNFVEQSRLLSAAPVVVINLNVPRPPAGQPALLTLDEVITAFHEFGHVLHGLLSDVRYPRLSGTNVPRDFVEFPSQVNEMWAMWPPLLASYAVHHETGESLPDHAREGLLAAQSYGQGFAMAEILAAMLLDQAWHQRAPGEPAVPADEVDAFEQAALDRHGLALPMIPPRYGSTYFAHIFAGGYSAAYYSYLWSEVLDADAVDWFIEAGGLQRGSGEVFARELLSKGGAVDPMAAFTAFRGRPPRVEPLLERRGLLPA
jgi:peptidyl-dipeptidase Dcp